MFVLIACRLCKRHHIKLSLLLPLACIRGVQPHIACRSAQSPVAQASGLSPPIACARGALPSESPHVCREIPMAVCSSSSHPPQQWHLASPAGPDLLLGSLTCGIRSPAHGTLVPSPSSCLHTVNPSPLPRTEFRSLSLSAQLPPKLLRLWCQVGGADDL